MYSAHLGLTFDPATQLSGSDTVLATISAALSADPDMRSLLDTYHRGLKPAAIETCDVEDARAQPTVADAVVQVLHRQGRDIEVEILVPGVTATDRHIPGANGELRARFYVPVGTGPFPVVLYFHGGGWVLADLAVYDTSARGLCAASGAIVVSVDYRQAPEHRFPAAWDDALAAYIWITKNATNFDGDPARLAIAGESAGGCLAVATAIAARVSGLTPPRHLLAIYPVAQTGLNTPSYLENALARPLNRAMMGWFFNHVLRSDDDRRDPRIDLINADLYGLPDTTIINATIDPLRSDGAMLEAALRAAGVAVLRREYLGVSHEFFGTGAVVAKAREAQQLAGDRLRASFA
jgi:acetyl esterase